jgi:hypothetical protein
LGFASKHLRQPVDDQFEPEREFVVQRDRKVVRDFDGGGELARIQVVEDLRQAGVVQVIAMAGELDRETQDVAGERRVGPCRERGRESVVEQDRDQTLSSCQGVRSDHYIGTE